MQAEPDRSDRAGGAGLEERLRSELSHEPLAAGPAGRVDVPAALLFVAVLILLGGVHYVHSLVKYLVQSPFIDFAHYYTFTSIVALGQNPFDPAATAAMDAQLGIRRAMAAPNYPPLFYVLMQPWARLPYEAAAAAWLLFSQACLFTALALIVLRERDPGALRLAMAAFVVLNFQPLYESAALGQSNAALLLLITAAWWGGSTGRTWMIPVMLGLAVQIKVQYGFMLIVLWWMGWRRAFAGACLAAAGGTALGWALLGADHYRAYLSYLASPPSYLAAWTANLSLRGMMHRLVEGLGGTTAVAEGAWLVAVLVVLTIAARAVPRTAAAMPANHHWVWGLGLAVMLLISPLTEEHHMVVLLFPLAGLVLTEPQGRWGWPDRVLLTGSVLLLGSLYSLEQFPEFHRGVWSIGMTGKLLGVGCLGWALQRRVHSGAAAGPVPACDRTGRG